MVMEKAIPSLKCVIILALFSSFQILCTEGRKIKSVDKQELVSNKKYSLNEMPKSNLNLNHNSGEEVASSPFAPSSNHNTYTGKEEMPMSPPEAPTSSIGFRDSAIANKDDFRPTPPGNSPGIGHHLIEDSDQEVDRKSLGATSGLEYSIDASSTDDFRPTGPGHSPGIGHASGNKN